jgi:hypothetical protein
MKKLLAAWVALLALTGCFTSKPVANTGFTRTHGLSDLDGTYLNLADSDPKGPVDYLSRFIWPHETFHPSIDDIEVKALGDSALQVRAHAAGEVRKEHLHGGPDPDADQRGAALRPAEAVSVAPGDVARIPSPSPAFSATPRASSPLPAPSSFR